MRHKWPFLLFIAIPLLLEGCATIEKPEVQKVTQTQTQVSPVLTESSPKRFLKRKVAIARFSNETKYGQSFFYDGNQDLIGKQTVDMISAKLAATDKFILLERADLDKISKEREIVDLAPLKIAADYLIIGSVSEFGRKDTGEVGVFSRTKKQTAYAKVNIRLVDVHTSQVIYSEEGQGEAFAETGTVMGVGGRAGYDSTLNDKAISAAISSMVNNVISKLLDKPWRSYILAYESGSYIVAGGKSQGLRTGDVFIVYSKGKSVKNPQTGMPIELPGQPIGEIQINSFSGNEPNDEISFCSKISGNIPNSGLGDLYIQETDAL